MSILLAVLRSNFGSNLLHAGTTAFRTLQDWISASCSSGVVCGTLHSCWSSECGLLNEIWRRSEALSSLGCSEWWLASLQSERNGRAKTVRLPSTFGDCDWWDVGWKLTTNFRQIYPVLLGRRYWYQKWPDIHTKFHADPSVVPVIIIIIIIIITYCNWVFSRWQYFWHQYRQNK